MAGVVRESISQPNVYPPLLLLMVLHPDVRHWPSVFIVCSAHTDWLQSAKRQDNVCFCCLPGEVPLVPKRAGSYSNCYKVQRMPASSWCGAASSCGCTPESVRNREPISYSFTYLFILPFSERFTEAWTNKWTLSTALFWSELQCGCAGLKKKKNKRISG